MPFAVTADAADVTASGECGDNLTWVLDSDGTLTISGTVVDGADLSIYNTNGECVNTVNIEA